MPAGDGGERVMSPRAAAHVVNDLGTVITDLPETFVRYDASGRITFVNAEFTRKTGMTLGEVVGQRPFAWSGSVYDDDQVVEYRRHLDGALATGESRHLTLVRHHDDGTLAISEILLQPEFDTDGVVVGAFGLARDITDLYRARQDLASREHQFRTLAENLPEVLVRYDRDGRATYANEQFELQVGGPSIVGRLADDMPSRSRPYGEYRILLRRVLETGAPARIELNPVGPDGRERFLSVLVQPEFDTDGGVAGAIAIGSDVTDLVRAKQAIAESERKFRSLAEHVPDMVVRYDVDARATYVNRSLGLSGGRPADGLIGRTPLEAGPAELDGLAEYDRRLRAVIATGVPDTTRLRFTDHGGTGRTHHVILHPERSDSGEITGALAIGRDITDLVRAERDIAESERQFRTLAANATDLIGRWGRDGTRLYVNPALAEVLGAPASELIGRAATERSRFAEAVAAIRDCMADGEQRTVVQHICDPQGEERVHEMRLVPERDDSGAIVSVLGIGRDITEVVRQREALEHAARTDSLTRVSTRPVLYDRLPALIERRRRAGGRIALLLVDLDGFKHVNDQHGHRVGDGILREVACRLRGCLGVDGLLVRLGGDEFVMVIDDIDSPTDAALLAHEARMQLAGLDVDEGGVRFPAIDASVGIALFPDDGDEVDVLLSHADLALYAAKRAGRGRVEFFRPEMRAAMERRSAIEQALRGCDPATDMTVHLQPICALGEDSGVWGAEALLRWTHPTLGELIPDEFIPIAEQTGQIVAIGRWVLRRAAEIAADLNRGREQPLRVAVNVSTRQFTLDDIGDAVRDALRVTGCDARWLVVELTETLLLEDLPLVNRSLESLRTLGVAIAIDDFGTGYSSLHYLTRLRIDHMKIDKMFVRDADVDHQQQEIVRALMAMAQALGIGVVAEGIETRGQAALLEQLGCRLGQGYLLAHPMPADRFAAWLADTPDTLPV